MAQESNKKRAPRNKTVTLTEKELNFFESRLLKLSRDFTPDELVNKTINLDLFTTIDFLPEAFVDLLFLDPPYNLTKTFNNNTFKEQSQSEYSEWFESWFVKLLKVLKPNASVYICGDWRSSTSIHLVAQKYLNIRNRITWEREKGRGALNNWKNCSEDIWFCTMSDEYTFNVDAVKMKRRVIAPYKKNGAPKDWQETNQGNFRLTYPSNMWTDLTIPFWSMPENTDHPTQKPEKLLAKIILASSNPNDLVFDPFLGSGTSSVVAKKLKRNYLGIELEKLYCCLAEKRLEMANDDSSIQGYAEGVFWERNTHPLQKNKPTPQPKEKGPAQPNLFESGLKMTK